MANRLETTTRNFLEPKWVDTVLSSSPLIGRLMTRAVPWVGDKIEIPVKVSSSTGEFFKGLATLTRAVTNQTVKMVFDHTNYHIDVSLPIDEVSKNAFAGENRILDLAAQQFASKAQDAADELAGIFYSSTGANNQFLGLEGIVDDGTNLATIGGLSRTTYPTLRAIVNNAGGVLTLDEISTLLSNITSGTQKPTVGLCNEAVWDLIEKLIDARDRIIRDVDIVGNGLTLSAGATALFYRGIPIIADEKATAQTLYFLNENTLKFRYFKMVGTQPITLNAKIEGNDYGREVFIGFSSTDWKMADNQSALVKDIFLSGNLIPENPKRNGKLINITSA